MKDQKPLDPNLLVNGVFIARTEKIFERAIELIGSGAQLLLATADGQPIVSSSGDEERVARYSALSCALLSLSESFSNEVLGVSNEEISVSTAGGHAALMRLELRGHLCLVCLSTTDKSCNLATVLRLVRDVSKKLYTLVNY